MNKWFIGKLKKIFYFVSFTLLYIQSFIYPSDFTNFLGVFLITLFSIEKFFKNNRVYFIYFVYFSTIYTQGILGCFIIEKWKIPLEIGESGFLTGATLRLIYYYYCSILIFELFNKYELRKEIQKIEEKKNKKIKQIEIVFLLMTLYLYFDLFAFRKIPILNSINRVEFKASLPYHISFLRSYFFGMSAIFLGYFYQVKHKKKYLIYLLFILFYFILSSEKYGMLLYFISNFLLGIVFLKENIKISKRYIVTPLIILSIILKFHYTKIDNFGGKTPYHNIFLRVGNGAQVFWKIDNNVLNGHVLENKKSRLSEYLKIKENNVVYRENVGMKFLMKEIAPSQIYDGWQKLTFKSLAFGNPAILIYFFGYITIILQIFFIGIVMTYIRRLLISSLNGLYVFEMFFIAFLLSYEGPIMVQGDFQILFSLKYILVLILISLTLFLRKNIFKIVNCGGKIKK